MFYDTLLSTFVSIYGCACVKDCVFLILKNIYSYRGFKPFSTSLFFFFQAIPSTVRCFTTELLRKVSPSVMVCWWSPRALSLGSLNEIYSWAVIGLQLWVHCTYWFLSKLISPHTYSTHNQPINSCHCQDLALPTPITTYECYSRIKLHSLSLVWEVF